MSILTNLLSGPTPTAVMYLRQEGPMTAAELLTAIAPLLERYQVLGQEAREIPVSWSVKSVPQEDGGAGAVYEWEVSSPQTLKGLPSLLMAPLSLDPGADLSREVARYSERRPFPTFTSFKLLLKQKVPGDPATIKNEALSAWRSRVTLPGSDRKVALVGEPIAGDRGEVPTPTPRRTIPRWAFAAGALALVGIGVAATQKGSR